jgi:sugar fermentation stimulation protein A
VIRFDQPMVPGTLVRRYKRFLADVRLANGRTITVHCPNSGRMTACCEPGRPVMLSDSQNPARKLRFTWELIQMGRTWVSVHSARSNHLVERFVRDGGIPELDGYDTIEREVKCGPKSRLDFRLRGPAGACWMEVKHCSMRVGHDAAFPDAVSVRAQKHVATLRARVRRGERAVIFFVVGRNDCRRFRPADEVDPDYGRVLRAAVAAGVEALAYRARFSPEGVWLARRLPVDL